VLDNLPALVSVFGLAFVYMLGAIPLGLGLRLSPVTIIITATLAYAAGVAIVVLPGQRVRDWLTKKLGDRATIKPDSFVGKIWARFGLPGLGLIAPVTTGAQIGALIGLAFNASPRALLFWMTLGGLLWTIVLTLLVTAGLVTVGAA
jgi:hypothetical protein